MSKHFIFLLHLKIVDSLKFVLTWHYLTEQCHAWIMYVHLHNEIELHRKEVPLDNKW